MELFWEPHRFDKEPLMTAASTEHVAPRRAGERERAWRLVGSFAGGGVEAREEGWHLAAPDGEK